MPSRAHLCPRCFARTDGEASVCLTDGAWLLPIRPLDDDPLEGRVLGGYRLEVRIGQGGMGAVYAARHLATGTPAAVKLLHAELATDSTLKQRFVREAQAALVVDSPRVVKVLGSGEAEDGSLFLVMELVEGQTLAARIAASGALDVPTALYMAHGVAAAVAAAHRAGVVHRDLKPDNVMLTVDSRVRVVDFGIARLLSREDSSERELTELTRHGSLLGTPLYMSPEAAARRRVGPPADLYALGIILYEMIVGEPPFMDDEMVLVLGMHIRVPPETLREASGRSDIPDGLESLVAKLLAKKPEERPDADATVEALEALQAEVGAATRVDIPLLPTAPGVGPPDSSAPPARREAPTPATLAGDVVPAPVPRPYLLVMAAAGLVLGGGVGLAVMLGGGDEPASQADVTAVPVVPSPTPSPEEAPTQAPVPEPPPAAADDPEPATAPTSATEEPSPAAVTGRLSVLATPACRVSIDGREVATTPLRDHVIAVGTHEVRCDPGGHLREVDVTEGASARLRFGAKPTVRRPRSRKRPDTRRLDITRTYE